MPSAPRSASARAGSRACTRPSCSASCRPRCSAAPGIDPELVEQVVGGCVTQAGEQSNDMVRRAWLYAGPPPAHRRHGRSTPSAARASSPRTSCTTWSPRAASTSASPAASRRCRGSRSAATCPPGLGDPRPGRLGHRHAQPVRGGRPDRQEPRVHPRRSSTRSAWPPSRRPGSPSTRAGSSARSRRSTRRCSTRRASRPARPGRRHRPGPARHHARGPGRPQAACCPTACTRPARRRRSPTARPPC